MNYSNIGSAVSFYQSRGYVYIDDAPWQVGRNAYYATRPLNCGGDVVIDDPFQSSRNYAVASGEQSFIQMMLDGQSIKRAICVTPCYRFEPRLDSLHRRSFMKVEIINAQDVDSGHLLHMIHDAMSFFEQFVSVRIVETPIGFDIVEKGSRFELGSYGIRKMVIEHTDGVSRELKWIYGTGCAEPRLSTAIQKSLAQVGR